MLPFPTWWKQAAQPYPIFKVSVFLRNSGILTSFSPEQCFPWTEFILVFFPLPNPNKHTNCFRVFLGWVFLWVIFVVFYFKYWKSPLGSVGLPTLMAPFPNIHCPSPHSKSISRTAFFCFKWTIESCSAEPEELFASAPCRSTVSLSDTRSPAISKQGICPQSWIRIPYH